MRSKKTIVGIIIAIIIVVALITIYIILSITVNIMINMGFILFRNTIIIITTQISNNIKMKALILSVVFKDLLLSIKFLYSKTLLLSICTLLFLAENLKLLVKVLIIKNIIIPNKMILNIVTTFIIIYDFLSN